MKNLIKSLPAAASMAASPARGDKTVVLMPDMTTAACSGFVKVEMMCVVAVVGILSAVAPPQYLHARNVAALGTGIGEASVLAKACATFVQSGVGAAPDMNKTGSNAEVTTPCGSKGRSWTIKWTSSIVGMSCLDKKSTAEHRKATISADVVGSISCELS